ncbi:MAG: hypothetical protein ACYTXA_09455 [Nostoc sp.]
MKNSIPLWVEFLGMGNGAWRRSCQCPMAQGLGLVFQPICLSRAAEIPRKAIALENIQPRVCTGY